MNWLKSLWNKLVNKTSVSPTLVVVEEVREKNPAGPVFYQVCRGAGMRHRIIVRNDIVEKFEDWYKGTPDRNEIEQSIDAFKDAHPELAPYTRPLGS